MDGDIKKRRLEWKEMAVKILSDKIEMYTNDLMNTVAGKLNLRGAGAKYYGLGQQKLLLTNVFKSDFEVCNCQKTNKEIVRLKASGATKRPIGMKSKKEKLLDLESNLMKLLDTENGSILLSSLWQKYTQYFHDCPMKSDFSVLNLSDVLKGMDKICVVKEGKNDVVKLRIPSAYEKLASKSSSQTDLSWGAGAAPPSLNDFPVLSAKACRKQRNRHRTNSEQSRGSSSCQSSRSSSPAIQPHSGIPDRNRNNSAPQAMVALRQASGPQFLLPTSPSQALLFQNSNLAMSLAQMPVRYPGHASQPIVGYSSPENAGQKPTTSQIPGRHQPVLNLQQQHAQQQLLQQQLIQQQNLQQLTASLKQQQPIELSSDSDSDIQDERAPTKAVKKLERKTIHVDRINVRGNLSKDQLETIAQDCIDLIADANEYVSVEKIEQLFLQRLNIPGVNRLGHGIRKIDHLSPVYQHLRMLAKVNAYIQAFVKTRSLYTLHELGEAMIEFHPEKKPFKDLHLGPLQCLPVVYEHFRFPQDVAEIPEITSLDLLEYIRDYMTKNDKWSERLELPDVMNFIVDERKAVDAYHLGIGIKSLPLAAQVLKKAQRDASHSKKEFYDSYRDKLKTDIGESFRKFRAVMLSPGASGQNEIRSHYLKTPPVIVIKEIFKKFEVLTNCVEPQTKTEQRKQRKFVEGVHKFFGVLEEDDLARNLFHLCVCISDTLLEESALELLQGGANEEDENEQGVGEVSQTPEKLALDRPSKSKVLHLLREYIERCLAHGSVSLGSLCRIEEKLTSEFNAEEFSDMGYGRFLKFITSDSDAKELLSECGGNISGSSSTDIDQIFKPSHLDVLVFIKQCFNAGVTQSEVLESALCNQFDIKDMKQLGYGNINTLKTAANRQGPHSSSNYDIIYESSLVSSIRSPTSGSQEVGLLGHQTKDTALCLLHNCPLLTDLYTWSHWTLVFEPQFGKLKDFIVKYRGQTIKVESESGILTTDILALETKPGVLLKLSSQSTIEKFSQTLDENNPVLTTGHLLSLIVLSKGVENTSLALLASHIKRALIKLHSESVQTESGHHIDLAAKFILECLCLLPKTICLSIANLLFLVPLSDVVGSTKSKTLIIDACQTPYHRTRLEELGCLFGIDEWTENFLLKSKPSKSDIQKIGSEFIDDLEELDEEKEIVIDSDESESFLSEDEDYITDVKKEEEKKITTEEEEAAQSSDVIIVEDEVIKNEKEDENQEKLQDLVQKTEDNKREDDQPDVEILEDTEIIDVHKKLIENIRKDVFGVGIELNEDGEKLVKILQERQGRSLDRLSKDLYSKDTHFVLELIQNADDNTYSNDVVKSTHGPSVMFKIDDNGITLYNNEVGFKEVEIRAICDVGTSTKGKHKYGYIGQKGIGFKSVFRITDRPEIHSNGYHFCFDVKSGPMGYIMPHWIDTEGEDSTRWTTKITLPIKDEMKAQTRPLAARFNDIHPSLLLFLHRLKEITIENKIEDNILKIQRLDKSDNIVEIKHGNKTDRWLVIKKILDSSKISLQVKSGVDVESTEIALAFPLVSKKQKKPFQNLPDKQLVFAFLPLRNYGFRFIIQGDFDVPSSRECVDRDSAWNQWLRNEIHTLFIEALDVFKAHPDFDQIEALLSFLQFVPMEDEILDFFKPVASQILGKLRAKECLPVLSSKPGIYEWKMPSQTVIVNDALVREVISPDILFTHLNLYYLSQDVANMLNPALAGNLGVERITTDRLLQIGKSLFQMFATKQIDKAQQVLTIAKWMACVYRSLDEFNPDESVYKELKSMRIIPLSTGEITSLSDETVFIIPPQNKTQKTKTGDPVNEIEKDLKTVDSGLISTPDNEINSQVQKLLLHIGIKQLSPNDLIHFHIIPTLQSDLWKNKSRAVLISYVMYIKNQYDKQPSIINLEDFKNVVQLATNDGFKSPTDTSIHFTPIYGSSINLPNQLPGYNWILIDGEYLTSSGTHSQHQWHDFLVKLGVTDFIHVKSQNVHISYEYMDKTKWAVYKDLLPKYDNGYIVSDFICEEFQSLVLHNKDPNTFHQQMKILFTRIDVEWNKKYSHYMSATIKTSDGNDLKTVQSSFAYHLKQLEWTPSLEFTKREFGKDFEVISKETNKKASDLYVPDPRIKNILAHSVAYINTSVFEQSSFCDFLQVKKTLDAQMVMALLIEWSQRSNSDQPASYIGSLNQMKSIYEYLCENLIAKEAQNLFFENAVIFVPKSKLDKSQDEMSLVDGLMLNREEVWWEDKSELFSYYNYLLKEYHSELADKHIISFFYKEFENLFVDRCKISRTPRMVDFAELLKLLVTVYEPTHVNVLHNVLEIYSIIGMTLTPVQTDDEMIHGAKMEERTTIIQKLSKLKIFCSKKDVWVCLDDKPMIADNSELEKMFADKENVHFVKLFLGNKQKDKRSRTHEHHMNTVDKDAMKFIKMFPIPKLSESIRINVVPGVVKPNLSLNVYMHHITPIIQRYLYTFYQDVYDTFVSQDMAQNLQNLQFLQAGKLEVVYSLKNNPSVVISKDEKCAFEESTFYFDQAHVDNYSIINKEIANYFSQDNNELKKYLSFLLSELRQAIIDQSSQALREIIEKEDIEELPSDEVPWFVPPPVIQPRIPTPPPPPAVPVIEDGEGGSKEKTLRSWPPQAPDDGRKRDSNVTFKPLGATLWPPPKPEGHVPIQRSNFLPSNIKVVDAPLAEGSSGSNDPSGEVKTERPTVQRVPSVVGCDSQEHRPSSAGSSQEHAANTRPVSQGETVSTGMGSQATSLTEDTGGDSRKRKMVDNSGIVGNESKRRASSPPPADTNTNNSQTTPQTRQHRSPSQNKSTDPNNKRPFSLDAPKWQDSCTVIPYHDLPSSSDTVLPLDFPEESESDLSEVGKWGEQLVYDYLLKQKNENSKIESVEWVNEEKESGNPYDFVITYRDDNNELLKLYSEVKSTRSNSKRMFEISMQEVKFAMDNQVNYEIYRLFNAGQSDNIRLVRINNLSDTENIRLCMFI